MNNNDSIKINNIPDYILNMKIKDLFSYEQNDNIIINKHDGEVRIDIIKPECRLSLEWKQFKDDK